MTPYPVLRKTKKYPRDRRAKLLYPVLESFRWQKKPKRVPIAPRYAVLFRRMYSERTQLSSKLKTVYLNATSQINTAQSARSFSNNPNWRQEVADGLDATYPYYRYEAQVGPVRYAGITTGSGYFSESFGSVGGQVNVSPGDYIPLQDEAMRKLKNKLSANIGRAQLAAPLAESKEIGRLVRQINGLGMTTFKSLLALKKTKGKSVLKLFGDVWLGFGFGVNPMLHDIKAAADAILDYQQRTDCRSRVTGYKSTRWVSRASSNPGTIAFGTGMWLNTCAIHTQSVRITAGVDLKLRSAASYSTRDHLGLKITDVPEMLWELVPYSWAVDYFATVSPWLEDIFFTLPGDTIYISQSKKYRNRTVWSLERIVNTAGFNWQGHVNDGYFKYDSFTRSKLTNLPTRSLRFKTVDEIARHGASKMLNLAAVLASRKGTGVDLRYKQVPFQIFPSKTRPA